MTLTTVFYLRVLHLLQLDLGHLVELGERLAHRHLARHVVDAEEALELPRHQPLAAPVLAERHRPQTRGERLVRAAQQLARLRQPQLELVAVPGQRQLVVGPWLDRYEGDVAQGLAGFGAGLALLAARLRRLITSSFCSKENNNNDNKCCEQH